MLSDKNFPPCLMNLHAAPWGEVNSKDRRMLRSDHHLLA